MKVVRLVGGKPLAFGGWGTLLPEDYCLGYMNAILKIQDTSVDNGINMYEASNLDENQFIRVPVDWTGDVNLRFVGGSPIKGDTIVLDDSVWAIQPNTDCTVDEWYPEDGIPCYRLKESSKWAPVVWFQESQTTCHCSMKDLLTFGHKCGKKAPIDLPINFRR
jgi:hypothetical protein